MKNAYTKDILRTIKNNAKRFVALMAITMLGLTAFVGIYAACRNMYGAAARFYTAQNLFDVRVLSTLGLTEDDVTALRALPGIEVAEGGYSETVYTTVEGQRQSASLAMLGPQGLNQPYATQGRLPAQPGEVAVTQNYLDATGKQIGDTLTIEEEFEEDTEETGEEPVANAEQPTTGDADDGTPAVEWDADLDIEEEPEAPTFPRTQYTITAAVVDPMDISNNEGSTAFRASAGAEYSFFILPADVHTEVYTAVYLKLAGLEALDPYGPAYKAQVDAVIARIEAEMMEQRETARYNAIMEDALARITDAEATMEDAFSDADAQFADALADIEDAKRELASGEAELTREERDALAQLADAQRELQDGRAALEEAGATLAAGEAELAANAETLAAGKEELAAKRAEAEEEFAAAEQTFTAQQAQLATTRAALLENVGELKTALGAPWPEPQWNALVGAAAQKTAALLAETPGAQADPAAVSAATAAEQAALAAALTAAIASPGTPPPAGPFVASCIEAALALGITEGSAQFLAAAQTGFETQKEQALQQLADAEAELAAGETALEEGRTALTAGRAQLANGWATLMAGEAELAAQREKALRQLADAWREVGDGKADLAEGEAELAENQTTYLTQQAEARQKLADAYAELGDIDMAQWYVQDRTALDSFSSLDNDLSSIDAIGRVFPLLFLVVAILISLTTMARMVEEERGLIGTYKALGFGNVAISLKYLLYALLASLSGGVLGGVLGFVALPKLLLYILGAIYTIPHLTLRLYLPYGLLGVALFAGSILIATALACRKEVRQTPASLMRPKAPRKGSRIFLERIPALWQRMRFLNKVTARNLFRYKKRLFMTVVGIAGCTALVLAGFAIRDSVTDLMPRQYGAIYRYDLMAVADPDEGEALLHHLETDAAIADMLPVQIDNVKALNAEGASESVQMIVVPTGADLSPYIHTENRQGQPVTLGEEGVLLTQNAAGLLGIRPGGALTLQTQQLQRHSATVQAVVQNYLGNNVFVSQTLYESMFGAFAPNAAYAHFAPGTAGAAYAEALPDEAPALTAVSTEELKAQFSTNFAVLNAVIYLLIVLAAGLAFAVLFTLSNTNISERQRELTTIKVLGFYEREVHAYVNKETLILTLLGVLAGLPLGHLLSGLLLSSLQMPQLEFVLSIHPLSYLLAGVISFSFALVVNLLTNRVLNKINMVEALKSVE